jgi:antitoxin component of RelBE/YafQ-DinJ toxin-antitoxin module
VPKTKLTAFRLEPGLLQRVAQYAKQVEAQNPGLTISTAAAVRMLLTKALDDAGIPDEHNAKKRSR